MRLIACDTCHTQYDVTDIAAETFPCRCGKTLANQVQEARETKVQRCDLIVSAETPESRDALKRWYNYETRARQTFEVGDDGSLRKTGVERVPMQLRSPLNELAGKVIGASLTIDLHGDTLTRIEIDASDRTAEQIVDEMEAIVRQHLGDAGFA